MDAVAYRERVHDALSDPTVPVQTRVDNALEIGVEYLGLPVGFFTRITEETQEIVRATGDHRLIQPGETCPLDDAYCRRTIEIESPLAIQDADASSAVSDSAVETFGLGSYIGARVVVKDETYGTLCFADTETRPRAFSEAESYFVELAAKLVGQALEQQSYQRELAEREAEVHSKEEIYRAVVNASFDMVLRIDEEGNFSYVSEGVEDLLGYTAAEYVGKPFVSMLPDQETIEIAQGVYDAVMNGETVEQEYFPLQHKSDEQVLVDIRVTPLYAGGVPSEDRTPADIVGIQGMARDARGRHRRQRLIRVLNRVLRHNLRNDVGVISNYASVLEDRLEDEEASFARKILEQSDRLITLSETARKLESNLDSPAEIDSVDVVPVVVRTATEIDNRYPETSVTVNAPESAAARSAPRLKTALWEVMDNAAIHAGEHPAIEVTVEVRSETILIRVADDGPGLPEQEREVLACGEETPLVHGSGLGLWLVYWVVESLDGTLRVRDDSDGACIEISLHRTADEP